MATLRGIVTSSALAALLAAPVLAQDAGSAVRELEEGRGPAARDLSSLRRRFHVLTHAAVDATGRVVVAGTGRKSETPAVARFLPDGRLDRTFGRRGFAVLPLVTGTTSGLFIDGAGRILVTGSLIDRRGVELLAAALTADGSLDASWSDEGLLARSSSVGDLWIRVCAAPDGSLVAATREAGLTFLVRTTADGRRDREFGTAGLLRLGPETVEDLAVDAQGRIVLATTAGVVRVLANGERDLAFGAGGALATASNRLLRAIEVEIDAQGRIVTYGQGLISETGVHRFLEDGAVDTSFGRDGIARRMGALPPGPNLSNPLVLAVAGAADRYALAGTLLDFGDDPFGLAMPDTYLASIAGSAPDDLALRLLAGETQAHLRPTFRGVAVSPDGATAVLVGESLAGRRLRRTPWMRQVALETIDPYPLPDVELTVSPATVQSSGGRLIVRGSVEVRNLGTVPAGSSDVTVVLSDDDVIDSTDDVLQMDWTASIAPGRVVTVPVFGARFSPLTGKRLIATFDHFGRRLVANPSDDVAVSAPLE